MPKMKTHRGAAKRFKITGKGKLRRMQAGKSHLLGDKSAKRKRRLRHDTGVSEADEARIRKLLPYL